MMIKTVPPISLNAFLSLGPQRIHVQRKTLRLGLDGDDVRQARRTALPIRGYLNIVRRLLDRHREDG